MKFTSALLALALFGAPALAQAPAPPKFEEAAALFQNRDYAEAKRLAEGLAAKGDHRAELMLGTMAQRGLGVVADTKQAQSWFAKAAEAGDADGQFALAMLLLTGAGEKPNVADGGPWLAKAAEAGQVKAQYNLGLLYSGIYNSPPDWPKAAQWFRAAADKGNPRAQYNLGLLHLDGKGVDRNDIAAANLFAKAAAQGLSEAALEYGVMVFKGQGVQKDEALGTKWLLVSAQHGNPVAQNRLARILGIGVAGVPQDPVEAMKWNLLAKAGGRGDQELDDATAKAEKADKGMVQDARDRAQRFKPLPDPTVD